MFPGDSGLSADLARQGKHKDGLGVVSRWHMGLRLIRSTWDSLCMLSPGPGFFFSLWSHQARQTGKFLTPCASFAAGPRLGIDIYTSFIF